jgi:hypothetical protein
MNLDRAFVLLLASIGAVAGFTPSGRAAFSVASSHSSRVAFAPRVSALLSEVEQAAEATETVAAASSSEEPAAKSAFDSAIYVGNISFGQLLSIPSFCSGSGILIRVTRHLVSHLILLLVRLLKPKIPARVISWMLFLRMDRSPRSRCRLTEIR